MQESEKLTSDLLKEIAHTESYGDEKITLFDIKAALHERGFGILIIIFSLPLSVPIPVPPGYTTIFSIPLILLSLQFLLGFNSPWMPCWLEKRSFQRSTLAFVVEKTFSSFKRIESFMKPRMFFIFCRLGEKILAFIMLLCALSIAIPLPLTNFIPAIGTILISLGIVNRDGFLSILGVLISLCGLLLTVIVIVKGPQLLFGAFSFLKSFIYG
ncbi:MAG: exopolysaccharide biosynthesis protein [Wolbachia endosymbiont of Menacanthus eurysternus]|nr:MAG: exopolysaccharide biosynthesis protein [Wolbachia endosymbiont of Menacanthus eurysternus]